MKLKICSKCGKETYLFKSNPKLCKNCWQQEYAKPLKKISDSFKETLDEYSLKKIEYFKKVPRICKVRAKGCTYNKNVNIHHIKGKSSKDLYLDFDNWLPCCNSCNLYLETNPEWAYEKGFKSRKNYL